MDNAPDFPTGLGDDPVSMVIAILVLIVMVPFLVLGVVASVELLLVLLVLPFAVLGRVLFGRHWTVEVRRGWRPWWEVQAGDWRASATRIHDVVAAIRRGDLPPGTLES